MQDLTNEQLIEIIANKEHESWQDALNELRTRINDSGYNQYRGFERPQNPPPNP